MRREGGKGEGGREVEEGIAPSERGGDGQAEWAGGERGATQHITREVVSDLLTGDSSTVL